MTRRRGVDEITIPPDVVHDPTPLSHLATLALRLQSELGDLDPDIALWPVTVVQRWPFVGAPLAGSWPRGWVGVDAAASLWVCTEAGEPGSWDQIPPDVLSQVQSVSGQVDTNTGAIAALQAAVQAIQTNGAPYSAHHVKATIGGGTAITLTADGITPIVFPTVTSGSDPAYDPATGIYTCPVAGVYLINVQLSMTASSSGYVLGVGRVLNGAGYVPGPLGRNPNLGSTTSWGPAVYGLYTGAEYFAAGAQINIAVDGLSTLTGAQTTRYVSSVTFDFLGLR